MRTKHIIPCGGSKLGSGQAKGARVLALNLWGGNKSNVTLKVEDLHAGLFKAVPAQFEDLLEIAAYVYCADQATSRGGKDVDNFGGRWRRHFDFRIPVRVPGFWNRPEVKSALCDVLQFLSDDQYDFEFVAGSNAPPMQQYFPNLGGSESANAIEEVVLFSGGLDSLAGAVEEAVVQKRRVLLLTHRPTHKLINVHRKLEEQLAAKAGAFRPTHLHVRVWKDSDLNKGYTQRTRSFLYAAVGATVAEMLGLKRLRFYENGVVSLNLPVCAQVVGSRATRTTHPRVLAGFERLFGIVGGVPFQVENPFLWKTKADVIRGIVDRGCSDLIASSVSCAHVYEFSHEFPHCGTCSQCIDRRLGMVAAGADGFDPATGYKSDVFTGTRPDEEDRMMVATYVERANRIAKISGVNDLISNYSEVVKVLRYLPGKPDAVAQRVLDLHKRHANEVNTAIERMLAEKRKELRERSLPPDCLLRLTCDSVGAVITAPPSRGLAHQEQELRWEGTELDPSVYRLRKGHKCWRVVHAGEEDILGDERAVELVAWLLKNPPDEAIHATVLEQHVDGRPIIEGFDGIERGSEGFGDGVGGVIQEAAGKKLMGGAGTILKTKKAELTAAIGDVTLPASERAKAVEELEEIVSGQGRGGKFVSGAQQSVDRVRKAIKRLIGELKTAEVSKGKPNKVLRAFGEHLEQHLWLPSMGAKGRAGASGRPGCFTYEPPPGVVWKE